jgi:ABC-type spermidine/putrescine transport system permease subunit I
LLLLLAAAACCCCLLLACLLACLLAAAAVYLSQLLMPCVPLPLLSETIFKLTYDFEVIARVGQK